MRGIAGLLPGLFALVIAALVMGPLPGAKFGEPLGGERDKGPDAEFGGESFECLL